MLPTSSRLFRKSGKLNPSQRNQLRISEALDRLRKFGYHVFHDLMRDGYHIEHVIVGPTGVFAIETKFRIPESKVQWQPRSRIIKGNCEFDGWLWPLAVIAGEWRVKNDVQSVGVRLFTIEKLVDYIVSQQSRFTSTEIKLIASHLERSVKSMLRLNPTKQ